MKLKNVLLIIICTICVCFGIFGIVLMNQNSNNTVSEKQYDTTIDDSVIEIPEGATQEEIESILNQQALDSMITMNMNLQTVCDSNSTNCNFNFVNEEQNGRNIIVEVYLKDTNELIYTSKAIPVGKQITNADLNEKLEPGTYKATALFTKIDENGKSRGQGALELNLTIKK